jgi:hypothetical protein
MKSSVLRYVEYATALLQQSLPRLASRKCSAKLLACWQPNPAHVSSCLLPEAVDRVSQGEHADNSVHKEVQRALEQMTASGLVTRHPARLERKTDRFSPVFDTARFCFHLQLSAVRPSYARDGPLPCCRLADGLYSFDAAAGNTSHPICPQRHCQRPCSQHPKAR